MKRVIRFIIFMIIVYSLISGLFKLNEKVISEAAICTDHVEVINRESDRYHQRDWQFNDFTKTFCTSYQSSNRLSLSVGERRNKMIIDASEYGDFWGSVYRGLVDQSKENIRFIVDSLHTIARQRQLDRSELAEMVVTFVQDIPYSYILDKACGTYQTNGKPCIGNIALGILSPYEFLHSLYGDCDTRAVLIYSILEDLGFDPMIVVSNQYAHAMLALSMPSSGDHLRYRGKNYYFWETTATGWPLGMLPPTTNNINYWKIALVNEH